MVNDKSKYKTDYFVAGLEREVDMKDSAALTKAMHKDFDGLFSGIWFSKGTFSLQVKDVAKSHQLPPWCTSYTLQGHE